MQTLLPFFVGLFIGCTAHPNVSTLSDERWGYVTVRPKAHMFWWLYGADNTVERDSLPLILWLQGGPGGSGVGFGNFEEIGPLDVDLKVRETAWTKVANVLFVDTPVGCGFSYAEDDSAYVSDLTQVGTDLTRVMQHLVALMPVLQGTPFYIFCESYGGKYAAAFGNALHTAIKAGDIVMNFKGVALGDSLISPTDTVRAYGPYLYQASLIDGRDLKTVNELGEKVVAAIEKKSWNEASDAANLQLAFIDNATDHVDPYFILRHSGGAQSSLTLGASGMGGVESLLISRYLNAVHRRSLSELMNTVVRKKLDIIPANVIWGGQAPQVMSHLYNNLMVSVVDQVDKLRKLGYLVVVYQGQLDMMCGTTGNTPWMNRIDEQFASSPRLPLYIKSKGMDTQGFVKKNGNFQLFYIFNAGHMVPRDNGEMALEMVRAVIAE